MASHVYAMSRRNPKTNEVNWVLCESMASAKRFAKNFDENIDWVMHPTQQGEHWTGYVGGEIDPDNEQNWLVQKKDVV